MHAWDTARCAPAEQALHASYSAATWEMYACLLSYTPVHAELNMQ